MTELLTMEQLDFVSGGNGTQDAADKKFFRQLGYNMDKLGLTDAFLDNGIDFTNNYPYGNYYKICLKDKGWNCHPQWAVLGYILKTREYPGFNGSWTDENYTKTFLKENFGITI